MSATLKTVTLGCKVNQYETQYVREGLLSLGYRDAEDAQPADLCIVNTCTVTSEGDSKSRQIIRRLHRDSPHARIVVMGCYATRAPEEIGKLPGVAEIITDKRELPDLLTRFGVIDIPDGISGLSNRHRAYVKVQDGCLLNCTYCIIPKVRPQMYSRPPQEIIREIRRLVDNGYREIILTGIHLGHYGVDFNRGKSKSDWIRLSGLLQEICRINGSFRIRLSSIEATEVTRELVETMAAYPDKICPHLHVCLQSGSNAVLRRMARRWSARQIVDRCEWVKSILDRPALTTDVIVGFPGETDAEFEETLSVCREIGFSKIHMFPFSPRQGTPAAEMPGQLPKSVKSLRGRQVAAVEAESRKTFFESLVKRDSRVLIESVDETRASGTSGRYVPVRLVDQDNNGTIRAGDLATARLVESFGDFMSATLIA